MGEEVERWLDVELEVGRVRGLEAGISLGKLYGKEAFGRLP